ncbi:protein Hook homolog 2-like [Parambassis ranga]|uniref:Protein Hook homolog 2-like n=1 Tax=Parambassis ranga TaxID=210632 RepID=A0A6P7J481_9TELE|nr:protein Hook homolog 2-like [Parambassis ranga]
MSSKKEASLLDSTKAAASELQDCEKMRSRQEQEETLILTAWQSMQHSLCEDSGAPGMPQSFLAKQRQSTQARRGLSLRLGPR